MPIVRARVSDDFKQKLDVFCQQTGRREGELIRAVLGRVLDRAEIDPDATDGDAPGLEYEKAEQAINLSVTASEKRAIAARARAEGMRTGRWLVWLARVHLTRRAHFNPTELDALREASRQLAAVGSNLNQVAHALNADVRQRDRLTEDLLRDVEREVKSLRRAIKDHVETSINRWGI